MAPKAEKKPAEKPREEKKSAVVQNTPTEKKLAKEVVAGDKKKNKKKRSRSVSSLPKQWLWTVPTILEPRTSTSFRLFGGCELDYGVVGMFEQGIHSRVGFDTMSWVLIAYPLE